jgi:hypothetical protein
MAEKPDQDSHCVVELDPPLYGGPRVRSRDSQKPWTLHVRAKGRTWRLAGEETGLDPDAADSALLERLAQSLGLGQGALKGYAVDRAKEALVVRPWAVWG